MQDTSRSGLPGSRVRASRAEHLLRILLSRASQLERGIGFLAFLMLVTVLFADVLSREFTGTGLVWARQLGVYSNLLITMAGLGIASADARHFRPRFADNWLPRSWDATIACLQEALTAVFCLAFSIIALTAVAETMSLEERTAMPAWPVWPFQAVIPVAFLVAAFRHGIYAALPRLKPHGDRQSPDRPGAPG